MDEETRVLVEEVMKCHFYDKRTRDFGWEGRRDDNVIKITTDKEEKHINCKG